MKKFEAEWIDMIIWCRRNGKSLLEVGPKIEQKQDERWLDNFFSGGTKP